MPQPIPSGAPPPSDYAGGTRMRLFLALRDHPDGLSMREIKDATGMLRRSGHLAKVIYQEVARGRLRGLPAERRTRKGLFRPVTLYALTTQGRADLKALRIDQRRSAGHRIGKTWPESRRRAGKKEPPAAHQNDEAARARASLE